MNPVKQVLSAIVFLLFFPWSVQAKDKIVVLKISGSINPAVAQYVSEEIGQADADGESLVILEMDTPGGLDTSMRVIIKAIQGSGVPIATFVSPSGSRAASAGTFITIASHIAAMAHGTNIGAAHPVNMLSGARTNEKQAEQKNIMEEKVLNDASAYIRALAEMRGRNASWAEMAVRKSVSISEEEALKLNVIDLVAADREALIRALEGRKIKIQSRDLTLSLENKQVEVREMSKRLQLLDIISNPNVAYILLMLGLVGLYLELSNPGLILPGVIGGISLILALYAMQALPINYAGLLLILLGGVLFIAELNVMSFGLLSAGAVISILLGSIMLMDSDDPAMQISRFIIYPTVGVTGLIALGILYMAMKVHRVKPVTGLESMIGQSAVVKNDLDPEGSIFVHGEVWNAYCEEGSVSAGETVVIESVSGLKIKVHKPERSKIP